MKKKGIYTNMNKPSTNNEEWKLITDNKLLVSNDVEVSTEGNVRIYTGKERFYVPSIHIYNQVKCFNLNYHTFQIHRLVAQEFVPNPYGYSRVKHINGDKLDNRAENLEWIPAGQPKSILIRNGLCVYCKETDQIFRTLRSASYVLNLPVEWISQAIEDNVTISGCTFSYIDQNDELLKTHRPIYVDSKYAFELACQSKSLNQFNEFLDSTLHLCI